MSPFVLLLAGAVGGLLSAWATALAVFWREADLTRVSIDAAFMTDASFGVCVGACAGAALRRLPGAVPAAGLGLLGAVLLSFARSQSFLVPGLWSDAAALAALGGLIAAGASEGEARKPAAVRAAGGVWLVGIALGTWPAARLGASGFMVARAVLGLAVAAGIMVGREDARQAEHPPGPLADAFRRVLGNTVPIAFVVLAIVFGLRAGGYAYRRLRAPIALQELQAAMDQIARGQKPPAAPRDDFESLKRTKDMILPEDRKAAVSAPHEAPDYFAWERAVRRVASLGPVTPDILPALVLAGAPVQNFGPVPEPFLIENLRHPHPLVRREAIKRLARNKSPASPSMREALIRASSDPDSEVRQFALEMLAALPQKPPAVNDAISTSVDNDLLIRDIGAVRALAASDDTAFLLIKKLKETDWAGEEAVVHNVMYVLKEKGRVPEAAELCYARLESPDPALRRAAAMHLGELGPNAQVSTRDLDDRGRAALRPAAGNLARHLSDEDPAVREMSVHALRGLGALAGDALPALVEAYRRSSAETEHDARRKNELLDAALEIAAAGGTHPVLSELIDADDAGLRRLGAQGAKRSPAASLKALIASLESIDTEARRDAARALGTLGPAAAGAAPRLARIAADAEEDMETATAAAQALEQLGTAEGVSIGALARAAGRAAPPLQPALDRAILKLAPGTPQARASAERQRR